MTTEKIAELLAFARIFNQENAITGCLLFYDQEFVQIIEGPQKIVQGLYDRIKKDSRHTNIIFLGQYPITQRAFSKWSMGYLDLSQNNATDKTHFVNNFSILSRMISEKSYGTKAFWYIAKQLLAH